MAENSEKVHWIEVKFVCNGELAEALAEVLGRFVSNGVVVEKITTFNPHTQENEPSGELAVSGYLAVNEGFEEKKRCLDEALWHLGQIAPLPEPHFTPIMDQNWMAAWKKHYTPIPVGEKLLILPAWKNPAPGEKHLLIRINPAMAFGTGTHPTTQLSLGLLEKVLKQGVSVIDIGCGSGILSIAAVKLGASQVLAVDIDEQAVISTQENADLNAISRNQLHIGTGSVVEVLEGRFTLKSADLVLVNILAPIIISLLQKGLADLVNEPGMLLLSGILDYQESDVVKNAQKFGFVLIERLVQGDWVGLVLQKKVVKDQDTVDGFNQA